MKRPAGCSRDGENPGKGVCAKYSAPQQQTQTDMAQKITPRDRNGGGLNRGPDKGPPLRAGTGDRGPEAAANDDGI